MKILVLNAGSSSLKYKLFIDVKTVSSGIVERIGEDEVKTYDRAIEIVENRLIKGRSISSFDELDGIGHRVVHGGERFRDPALINDEVLKAIRDLTPLAPLHNPANLEGIEAMRKHAPKVPQVAVFDTAFHQSMPKEAFMYALPYNLYEDLQIRRYGFHGTSHGYIAKAAAKYLKKSLQTLNLITLHLGNGASACAIKGGKSIDTSMGFTPLEGLVMGTRCGDLDSEIPLFLQKNGMDAEDTLNHKSGLKGICEENDMRQIEDMIKNGDKKAKLAIGIFCRRIKKYIGAYMALLGSVDAVIFTAGIGENSALVRKKSCEGLEGLGIAIDEEANSRNDIQISTQKSKIKVLTIPTDEEGEIARQTENILHIFR